MKSQNRNHKAASPSYKNNVFYKTEQYHQRIAKENHIVQSNFSDIDYNKLNPLMRFLYTVTAIELENASATTPFLNNHTFDYNQTFSSKNNETHYSRNISFPPDSIYSVVNQTRVTNIANKNTTLNNVNSFVSNCHPYYAEAVKINNPSIVSLTCFDKDVNNINTHGYRGQTALHLAVLNNKCSLVEKLLTDKKIDPNTADIYGNTALYYAIEQGNIELYNLLAKSITVTNVNETGVHPIAIAIQHQQWKMLEHLMHDDSMVANLQLYTFKEIPSGFGLEFRDKQGAVYLIEVSPDSIPVIAKKLQSGSLEARLGYDIGSGGTKIHAIIKNVKTGQIIEELLSKSYAIKYTKDLQRAGSNDHFSKEIQEQGAAVLKQALKDFNNKLAKFAPNTIKKTVCGGATAAFRKAGNGKAVAQYFEGVVKAKKIEVLSQVQEGKIAYKAALTKAPHLKNPITWDVGSGSMQFTSIDDNNVHMSGSEIASQTMNKLIRDHFSSNATIYGNDFDEPTILRAIELIKSQFNTKDSEFTKIQEKIAKGSQLVGVGPFHNFGILSMIKGMPNSTSAKNIYTKKSVRDAINFAKYKEYDEIKLTHTSLEKDFSSNLFTDLLLTYATMDLLGINEVTNVDINNAMALTYIDCDWENKPIDLRAAI